MRTAAFGLTVALFLAPSALRAQGASANVPTPAAVAPGPRAAHDIPRGTVLASTDIVADSTPQAARLIGFETRRLVRQGETLKEPAVGPGNLVRSGSKVRIEAVVDGVTVTREGTADGSGALGDRIRVRVDARRMLFGIIAGPATVRLP